MSNYEAIEVKEFDKVGIVETQTIKVYFSHTEDFSLISIPEWNWSYLWNIETDDREAIKECTKALNVPMFEEKAEELANRFYRYLVKRKQTN